MGSLTPSDKKSLSRKLFHLSTLTSLSFQVKILLCPSVFASMKNSRDSLKRFSSAFDFLTDQIKKPFVRHGFRGFRNIRSEISIVRLDHVVLAFERQKLHCCKNVAEVSLK